MTATSAAAATAGGAAGTMTTPPATAGAGGGSAARVLDLFERAASPIGTMERAQAALAAARAAQSPAGDLPLPLTPHHAQRRHHRHQYHRRRRRLHSPPVSKAPLTTNV